MEFLITRDELRLVCQMSISKCYDLHENGSLTEPKNWNGSGKRFCLRLAANELAKLNKLEEPTDETILHYWNSIVLIRHQDALLAKKNKAKKIS